MDNKETNIKKENEPISFNIEKGSSPKININLNIDADALQDSSILEQLTNHTTKEKLDVDSSNDKELRHIKKLDEGLRKNYIQVINVTKEYGDEAKTVAIKNINLSINEGELVIFLGQSGAGKTTTLNMIGGMDTVTEGRIIVGDKEITEYDVDELTEYRRDTIGFIFQLYNLVGNLTAKENVELSTEISKDFIDAKIILDKVGLEGKYNKFPYQLSGGEQQRVAIARAMAKKPKLLLCDEPTGALDYATGKQVLSLIQQTNRENNLTTIIITHNQAITPMADRVVRFKSGKVIDIKVNENPVNIEDVEW